MEGPKLKGAARCAAVEKVESKTQLSIAISEKHKAQLREAFDFFDSDGTGRINAQDVKVAFCALGYEVGKEELTHLLRQVGASTTGVIDFNDFYSVIIAKIMQRENRSEAIRAFKLIDTGEKGYINVDDLRPIAASLQMNLTDDELAEMVLFAHPSATYSKADTEMKDPLTVSEEEFLKLMNRAHVY
ncbi:centrin, putative [Trypanosoma brucei gambiense DAL972]|uniref:Centrin, putative n=3 Tax=Trypanosoma brucei TaxID=5691 RepID=Q382E7_TRYB2|nr:centrin, putative [Trypanosoma brucei gambiense DAL972]XP_829446.1 centrin, putative [Trypanosoma brucei brucei TREU927]EAN80334.1 centrin, putative [Trypanosoma brucei brucei TREU927]RHW68426.1 centrin [Trypanosoma brucei equiperdum]CBH18434.1 centrin, putative [Trypanosoma brucei gambiense DAL972]|eukprot:XP_011780698.1 centrin, putative [Trypanosoma brucei gambiense DAL972]